MYSIIAVAVFLDDLNRKHRQRRRGLSEHISQQLSALDIRVRLWCIVNMGVCVCVRVTERERERIITVSMERESE